MPTRVIQRIKTPGFIRFIERTRGLKQRYIGRPVQSIQRSFSQCVVYSEARRVVDILSNSPETKGEFRKLFEHDPDQKRIVRLVGAALAEKSDRLVYRGRLARTTLNEAVNIINFTLAIKYSISFEPALLESAVRSEGVTPLQIKYFSSARALFWSLVRFPLYGFYLTLIEPVAAALHLVNRDQRYDPAAIRRELIAVSALSSRERTEQVAQVMVRKYQYVAGMAAAVIDLMKAASSGMGIDELCFEASRLIVKAIPFMTRSQLYRVIEIAGQNKAAAVAWAGKPGYHDMIVRAQGKLMGGKMVYDLVREGEARSVGLPVVAQREIEGAVGEGEGAPAAAELQHSLTDVSERMAGMPSLVALSIMDNRPFICHRTTLNPDGIATATDMITGETIHPNPIGMRALNVFEFFVAPFDGGALLGAVDLPKNVPVEEILSIMEAFQAYARILGMVISSRQLTDNLARAKERIEQLARSLEKFAPDEAIRELQQAMQLALSERNCVTVFADLSGSTRIDRQYQGHPAIPHQARNVVFDLMQRYLERPAFTLEKKGDLLTRFGQLFERAPVWGEFYFRFKDPAGVVIDQDYIRKLGERELLPLWQQTNESRERMRCQVFGFMGDAILGGLPAAADITPDQLKMMIFSLVRAARQMVNYSCPSEAPITYKMKVAVHGGLVSAGVLGSERRGQYTLIGYPIDVNARISDAHKEWAIRASGFGCRPDENVTLPFLISAPMMNILLGSEEGRLVLRRYVADFNLFIMQKLIGDEAFSLLVEHLDDGESGRRPLAEKIQLFLYNFSLTNLLRGFVPLGLKDLLKGPFDLAAVLGEEPRGMGDEKMGFYLLEWDRHPYHPAYNPAFIRAKEQDCLLEPALSAAVIGQVPLTPRLRIVRSLRQLSH